MAVQGSYNYQVPYYYDQTQGPLPGATLWEQFASVVELSDPFPIVNYKEDFLNLTIASNTFGGWVFTQATSGSIVQDTTDPSGAVTISAGAVTANQGVNWQLSGLPFRVAANKPVAFEAYFKFTGLTSLKLQTFVGLAATSTAIIASGAMADIDRIGFQGITTTGVLNSVTHNGAGLVTTGTGLTLANSTFYRLGFLATSTSISYFVNGVSVGALATNIPTAGLAPAVVVMANATVTPVMVLDYIRIAGYR